MKDKTPLPQNTKLYQVVDGAIISPRISTNSIVRNCSALAYSDFKSNSWLYQVYDQDVSVMYLSYNDKSVSIFRPNLLNYISYYSFNGSDPTGNAQTNGIEYRFLNINSPSIQFLPLVSFIFTSNVVILSGVIALSTTATSGNYIFLTNQTSSSENGVYRITSINGNNASVYKDVRFDIVTKNANQNVLTRVAVSTSGISSANYFGISYNGVGYDVCPQTSEIFLGAVDYGIKQVADLTSNSLPFSIFSSQSVYPEIGKKIAINISSGGYTSGIYEIYKITNNLVYFQPIYPTFVFYQQFLKVSFDFETLKDSVWFISDKIDKTLYGGTRFYFSSVNITQSMIDDPSTWASQFSVAGDTTVGWPLYLNQTGNPSIRNSDIFMTTLKMPNWVSNGSELTGLSLNLNYQLGA